MDVENREQLHVHRVHENDDANTYPLVCMDCGNPHPIPCSWGEQCGTYQAEKAAWGDETCNGCEECIRLDVREMERLS